MTAMTQRQLSPISRKTKEKEVKAAHGEHLSRPPRELVKSVPSLVSVCFTKQTYFKNATVKKSSCEGCRDGSVDKRGGCTRVGDPSSSLQPPPEKPGSFMYL